MTIEKFCLKCLREVFYDTTEHHYCCECFAVRTIPDENDMPSLEYVPPHWIETDTIPKMIEENKRLTAELDQLRVGLDGLLVKLRDDEAAEVVRVTGRSLWPGEG